MTRNTTGSRGLRKRAGEIAAETAALCCVLGVLCSILGAVLSPLVRRSLERSSRLARVEALVARAASEEGPVRSGGSREELLLRLDPLDAELTSWASIGGCGVTGGGGGGVRWIGRRSGGAPVEFELLDTLSSGEDLTSNSLTLKVTGDVPGRLNLGLSVPYVWNNRYDSDFPGGKTIKLDGPGDVSLLVTRQFGLEGNTSATVTVGLPTGEYDHIVEGWYSPPYDAQLGIGKPTLGVTVEHNLNRDWGPVILGGGYNYNGGWNDVEPNPSFRGDTLQAYCYVGYRTEMFVHSVGANLSYSLQNDVDRGNEAEGQLLLTLQYGLEISLFYRTPMFVALLATLGEESAANSTTLALGIVASF